MYHASGHATFLEGCQGFFGLVESNIIAVGPVRLLTSMGRMLCSRSYLASRGVEMKPEEWTVGEITPKHKQSFCFRMDIFKEYILAVALLSERSVFFRLARFIHLSRHIMFIL